MVCDRIEQFKKDAQTTLKHPDWKDLAMTTEEFMDKMLSRMSPERRLKGLPPEELVKCLPPEERLKGLSSEDVLKGLSPEARESLTQLLRQPM